MKDYINLGLSVDWENISDKLIIPTLPTKEHIKELLDKCDWIPTSINNMDGYKIIGNNGNSIFIPFPKIIAQNNNILKIKNISNPVLEKLIANMVKVEGGTFTMGATPEQGDDVYLDEKSAHQVTLSDYYIGRYEVTQKEWQAVMGDNPSKFKGDNLPVERVSWNDCNEFIKKLNQLTGLQFRLPTEAEWEFAARGGKQSKGYKYSGSNDLGSVAWYGDNSDDKTHQVGVKEPNELGIYDMSGNVWEWCSDWYGSYPSSSQINPTGPSSGSYRVLRGGSWYNYARGCRVSFRYNSNPSARLHNSGFRVVLD